MQITLSQYEQIDGAYSAWCLREDAAAESRLFDALIGLLGYQAANELPSVQDYAHKLILDVMTGELGIVDVEADDYVDDCDFIGRDEAGRWEYAA